MCVKGQFVVQHRGRCLTEGKTHDTRMVECYCLTAWLCVIIAQSGYQQLQNPFINISYLTCLIHKKAEHDYIYCFASSSVRLFLAWSCKYRKSQLVAWQLLVAEK